VRSPTDKAGAPSGRKRSRVEASGSPQPRRSARLDKIGVFDFFSGAGGTSAGLRRAGMQVIAGIDNDPDAASTFRRNFPEAEFLESDIATLQTHEISHRVDRSSDTSTLLFAACAPCQPFSKQNKAQRDTTQRRSLLLEFLRFVEHSLPDLIFVENVPGLQDPDESEPPFGPFVKALRKRGYHVSYESIDCRRYGVPQRRLRLVLLASLLGPIPMPPPTHGPGTPRRYTTVRDWIGDLPPIEAGEHHPRIMHHRALALSALNLRRIRHTPMGGDRRHWPTELLLDCHQKEGAGYSDVYGRMDWDSAATGLTTRCISLSNGRFGHPDQDRAISVREAACLQTFPHSFTFDGALFSMARQIGNAVPVVLARRFGTHLAQHRAHMLGVTR
jgi:DNA (cytosine-5)-methyltransferase 1